MTPSKDAAPDPLYALGRIEAWSRNFKTEARITMRISMQLIHEEATKALSHPTPTQASTEREGEALIDEARCDARCDLSYVHGYEQGMRECLQGVVHVPDNISRMHSDAIRALKFPAPPPAVQSIRLAALALVAKWPAVRDAVNAVIGLQTARGYPYTGPTIGKEFEALEAALKASDYVMPAAEIDALLGFEATAPKQEV